jgi:hypothetical protein
VLSGSNFTSRQRAMDLVGEEGENGQEVDQIHRDLRNVLGESYTKEITVLIFLLNFT